MVNRTEELRQQLIAELETAIADCEKYGNDEYGQAPVHVNIITARRTLELLNKLEVPVYAKWHYYTNDEGKARWKCSECGKVCKHDPYYKQYCSQCGSKMRKEA